MRLALTIHRYVNFYALPYATFGSYTKRKFRNALLSESPLDGWPAYSLGAAAAAVHELGLLPWWSQLGTSLGVQMYCLTVSW